MSIRRSLALAVVVSLTASMLPGPVAAAPQNAGTISGKATAEAKKPYDDYNVQLMATANAQIAATVPLDAQGRFSFSNVALSQAFLVQLFNKKLNKVVCTEGPYTLTTTMLSKTDVNINCGANPALWWLAAAGAGTAAAVALGTRSPSR